MMPESEREVSAVGCCGSLQQFRKMAGERRDWGGLMRGRGGRMGLVGSGRAEPQDKVRAFGEKSDGRLWEDGQNYGAVEGGRGRRLDCGGDACRGVGHGAL